VIPRMAKTLALLSLPLLAGPVGAADKSDYPPTPVKAVTDTLHGDLVVDPYRWLEKADDPAVEQWQEAQNAFTRKVLDAWPGRPGLTARYDKLFAVSTVLSAQVAGKRLFLQKKDGLQNQPVLELREGGKARVALDPNTFRADGTAALDWNYPSPDGSLIAYGKSEGGSEQSTLYVRDVATGKDLAESIPNTQYASVAWDPDGRGFHYTRHPAKGEVPAGEEVFHKRVFHHALGADWKSDLLVWSGEGAPIQEYRQVYDSSDHAWLFVSTSTDWAKNDLYVRAAETGGKFQPLALGLDGSTSGDAAHGELFLLTNVDAPRYRIVKAQPGARSPHEWQTVIPEQKGVIESFVIAHNQLVVKVSENATARVLVYDLGGTLVKEIADRKSVV